MRYLIFLLLISGSCLGQINIVEGYNPEETRGVDNFKAFNAMLEAAKNNPPLIEPAGSRWQLANCSHKWVELHQDTVEFCPSVAVTLQYPPIEPPINLICLICHQEKKKVIHYKRENQ